MRKPGQRSGRKAEKEGTDRQKGEQRGGRDWRGKGEREWEETVTGASERGHRPAERDNELSCGPCRSQTGSPDDTSVGLTQPDSVISPLKTCRRHGGQRQHNAHTHRDYTVFQASFRLLLNVRRWPALLSTADRKDETIHLTIFGYMFQVPALFFFVYSLLCHTTFYPYNFRVIVIWKGKLLKQFIFRHKTHDKLVKRGAWLWIKLHTQGIAHLFTFS